MSLMSEPTSSDSADLRGMRRRPVRELAAIIRLSRTLIVWTSPWSLRSAGTKPTPAAIAARGLRKSAGRPATSTRPYPLRRPKIASSSSERPAPTRPASPTTSPGATSSEMFSNAPGRLKSRTRSTASPTSLAPSCVASKFSSSRPTISAIRRGRSKSATMPPPTVCPSRRTVTRSAEREELAEPVRDEDDRDALGAQAPDEPEERLDLILGQRARRLVEDQHAGIDRERPRDLDHLLLVGPEPAHRHRRVEIEIEAAERLLRAAAGRAPVDEPGAPHHAVPEEDVLGDREIGRERRLLRDRRDALPERVRRIAEARRLARRR